MEINKQFKLLIIIITSTIIFFIIIFNISSIYINKENDSILLNAAKTMAENIQLIESKKLILPPHLIGIVEYDKYNFNNNRMLFKNLTFKIEELNTYKKVFIYDHPILEQKKLLFVFEELNHYYEIFSIIISSIVIMIFVIFLLFIIHLYFQRKHRIRMISSLIELGEIDLLQEELKNDNELKILVGIFKNYEIEFAQIVKTCKRNESKVEAENIRLKNRNIFKTGIIENVSHELMSPLTKIKGYLDFIYNEKMGKLNASQKSGLLVAKKNVNILLKQVEQILNYIKDESLILTKSLFSLNKLINDIITVYIEDAKEKEIGLEIDIDNIKSPINGNRNALYDVYNNIINNALKFTQKGGSIKFIGYEKLIDKTNYSIVKIIDSGIGISSNKLEMIFEKFYQIEHDENRKYQGMRLGLTIAKNIIDEHNGFIDVSSIVGRGSTVTIGIPIMEKEGYNEEQ